MKEPEKGARAQAAAGAAAWSGNTGGAGAQQQQQPDVEMQETARVTKRKETGPMVFEAIKKMRTDEMIAYIRSRPT